MGPRFVRRENEQENDTSNGTEKPFCVELHGRMKEILQRFSQIVAFLSCYPVNTMYIE